MGGGTLDAPALAARTLWLRNGLGGMRDGSFAWEPRPALNPFRDMNFDELTARGVLWSQGYPRTRTRRVLTLLNAVCAELERALSDAQRARIRAAYRAAGPQAVQGFRQVLEAMMDPEMKRQYQALKEGGA